MNNLNYVLFIFNSRYFKRDVFFFFIKTFRVSLSIILFKTRLAIIYLRWQKICFLVSVASKLKFLECFLAMFGRYRCSRFYPEPHWAVSPYEETPNVLYIDVRTWTLLSCGFKSLKSHILCTTKVYCFPFETTMKLPYVSNFRLEVSNLHKIND